MGDGPNMYGYVSGNPVMFVDPLGRWGISAPCLSDIGYIAAGVSLVGFVIGAGAAAPAVAGGGLAIKFLIGGLVLDGLGTTISLLTFNASATETSTDLHNLMIDRQVQIDMIDSMGRTGNGDISNSTTLKQKTKKEKKKCWF